MTRRQIATLEVTTRDQSSVNRVMSSSSTPSDSNQSGQTPKQPAKHDEMAVKSILARAAAAKTPEYPPLHQTYPSSMTGGVLPMVLVGRFSHERERLGPDFTDAERQWRIKWYKDQHLHPKEPFTVPLLEKEMRNPLRRFYKIPLNYLEHQILAPRFVSAISVSHFNVSHCLFLQAGKGQGMADSTADREVFSGIRCVFVFLVYT